MTMQWTVDSETGVLTDVLLCPPDHYHWLETNAVAVSTLASSAQFDRATMLRQWDGLISALESAEVNLHFLKPSAAHPYQVYTREYAAVLDFHLAADGFHRFASEGVVEGGDIHVVRPGLLIIGHSGVRTNRTGAEQFAGWFKQQGWETRLEEFPAHFLHLDVLFCMATDRIAVACIDVLGEDFARYLKAHDIDIVEASYPEVMAMSCNLLSLGATRVISPAHSVRINAELRARGVTVIDPPLDMFARGGGSIHCMTMPLKREALK